MSISTISFSQVKDYPEGVKKVMYLSKADQTEQPALFWKPETSGENEAVPLLVALHTWSSDFAQAGGEAVYAKWCQQLGWAFVHPNFRGPNRTPEALGSDLAVEDILSSIEYSKSQTKIDPDRIYCIGVSGGGHMSLLMAARAPDMWAGVSAWCGISDIAAWHRQCTDNPKFSKYAKNIEKALQGTPESSSEKLKSAQHRSPVEWLGAANKVNLDINHGVNDGREGSVPFSHSLLAWNKVVKESAMIDPTVINQFYETQKSPEPFKGEDLLYGKHQPLFQKTDGPTRVTIFKGGHEIVHVAALNWLAAQRKGKPAVWDIENPVMLKTKSTDTESGK